ncbi:MAG TPA: STAS domain-containing protein [Rhizomicrobium sp.]|jgi:anti-sigma B factor antagonist|nr:STAS domain-containing protein [Rhizomicrobium sp.]
MEMRHDNVGEVRRVVLAGRLDTAGVDVVETRFGAAIVPNGKNTIVDLTEVTFLASMGIRMLISTTRALSRKGGKLVMYGAGPGVRDVIETAALTEIIPLAGNESEALGLVG